MADRSVLKIYLSIRRRKSSLNNWITQIQSIKFNAWFSLW